MVDNHPLLAQHHRAPCMILDSNVSLPALQDLDDEGGVMRRSAARSNKRSRTAEVHNLSERVRTAVLDARLCQCARADMHDIPVNS